MLFRTTIAYTANRAHMLAARLSRSVCGANKGARQQAILAANARALANAALLRRHSRADPNTAAYLCVQGAAHELSVLNHVLSFF